MGTTLNKNCDNCFNCLKYNIINQDILLCAKPGTVKKSELSFLKNYFKLRNKDSSVTTSKHINRAIKIEANLPYVFKEHTCEKWKANTNE